MKVRDVRTGDGELDDTGLIPRRDWPRMSR